MAERQSLSPLFLWECVCSTPAVVLRSPCSVTRRWLCGVCFVTVPGLSCPLSGLPRSHVAPISLLSLG
ncbi:hypothetical protein RSOLAG1IB_01557 [Rhizoctonia solani AG-1 IB]|uniref:Uncharacterized protein n=1 Tax=Thanatephorus cucumeris (strain AG1-IB / isolate 7/3/14) TaxID=1108050 RepID=A0A0B7FD78_THACB|nr:hypothetical protein RSOLAG1IB_01557 [Rhizoctonia solani AG-1 IB]